MSELTIFEEDTYPHIVEVVGFRSDGMRYNSERGFIYYYHKSTSVDYVFVCKNRKFEDGCCRARVRRDMASGMYRVVEGTIHNHPPEFEEQRLVAFINECVTEAGKLLDESPRDIYVRVLQNYPGLVAFYSCALQRRIQRARRKALLFQQTLDEEAHKNSGSVFT